MDQKHSEILIRLDENVKQLSENLNEFKKDVKDEFNLIRSTIDKRLDSRDKRIEKLEKEVSGIKGWKQLTTGSIILALTLWVKKMIDTIFPR